MNKRPPRVDAAQIGSKKAEFQLELRNRFETLRELDYIDKDVIQKSASKVANAINKPLKSRISSPIRALMTKRRGMMGNSDNKQRIEYRNMQDHQQESKSGHQEIQPGDHTRNDRDIKEPDDIQKNTEAGKDGLIALLDKQGTEIHDQDKIIESIEEFYTELYDSKQSFIIHTNRNDVPAITPWEVEAALRGMKNGTATGNDHINIETLKAGKDTISKTLVKQYTKCLSERRISTAWKNAKMVIIFKKGNKKDFKNYRPICLLSNVCKVLTKVQTTKQKKTLDEKQP